EAAIIEASQIAQEIKQHAPALEAEVKGIEEDIAQLQGAIAPVIDWAIRDDKERALQLLHTRVDALVEKIIAASEALRDRLTTEIKQGNEALSERSTATARITWVVIGLIMAVAAGFAFMVATMGIATPIRNLATLLEKLARGEEAEIVGTE